MKTLLSIVLLTLTINAFGQNKRPEDFGYQHLQTIFKKDTVDILLKSKNGEELKSKPLFLFFQGSLPIPLIITQGKNTYPVFPFSTDSIIEKFHLVIISKPNVPLIADATTLRHDLSYYDPKTKKSPKEYSDRNYLDYYVDRNIHVIDFLSKQSFCNPKKLVIAGHSQGARIAFEVALKSKKVTNLIYAGGNPCGQIMSMIAKSRLVESNTDSTQYAENDFQYWEAIIADSSSVDNSNGDSNKSVYSFSKSSINNFAKIKIPVLVCYGTKDLSSPFNDLLRVEMLRQQKKNFTFKSYIGLDHNFFGFKQTGEIDYHNFNWDSVASDWLKWLHY